MNIAFFLTPKKDVVFLKNSMTVQKAYELVDAYGYTAMPVITPEGNYWGTVSEGDILRLVRNSSEPAGFLKTRIRDISPRVKNNPVRISCNIEDLVLVAVNQNFVPVIDDNDKFIGIIKRSAIINYCYQRLFKQAASEA